MKLNVDHFLCWFGELDTDVHSSETIALFQFFFLL